ncbi:MAG: glutamine--scyllo-inositol transaminase [Microgenomates group bacterium Gr01-1014_93]|nr:MAG: glutamine--scyllo-inositol transaminase [Microgenomates group bacterium Gr01-1014_93]
MQAKINVVDLKIQYKQIKNEVNKALREVISNADFILGNEVNDFEKDFANYCGVKFAVGVGSGVSALELGMRALGIGPGDEVITAANSFIASSSAISFTGARPILVDCREDFNIDPSLIEKKITKKTKAIMPVHLFGQPALMDDIIKIARKFNLYTVEDACQAHGAVYKKKKTGSLGDFGAFSFYPGKNLGAYGDGGILTTNNKRLAKIVSMMRNYGQKKKYHHKFLAWNSRLDSLQAAVLRVKLKFLDEWNMKRARNAKLYNQGLKGLPVTAPPVNPDSTHIYHLYVIRTKSRDKLASFLKEKGINTGIHYPIPIHLQEAYRNLGYTKGDFPITEMLAKEILSLPMYPELTGKQIKLVTDSIKNFFQTYGNN